MEGGRTVVLAMTMALLLAVAGQADGATTQEGRTTDRGTTNASASAADGPQGVTTLRAWGNNYEGQLGDETNGNNRTRPVKVRGLRGAKVEEIAAGQMHTLALEEDGTVLAWGYNRDGELGDGTNQDNPAPVQVKDFRDPSGRLSGVRAVAAGSVHSLALKEDGTVWAWGANDVGQLGNGTEGNQPLGINTPLEVKGLGGVELIAAGLLFSFAGSK
jgi:alpha-tubulin suppressor-like RCC1 family protein